MTDLNAEKSDIKVWSEDCKHLVDDTGEVSYLCTKCNKPIKPEVKHETMPPYLSGDYDNMS